MGKDNKKGKGNPNNGKGNPGKPDKSKQPGKKDCKPGSGKKSESEITPAPNENKDIMGGEEKKGKKDGTVSKKQDPFFYAKDERAIKDMASFPFLESVGDNIAASDSVPFLVCLDVAHCIAPDPVSTDNAGKALNSYATRAAQAFFEVVTQGYTGEVGFEAPDMLMTALASCSLNALMMEGKRAYGMMHYYLQFNEGYAQDIVEGLGFDFAALKAGLADFRSEYNIRVAQINKSIATPKGFMIGERWAYIASYLFTDTDSPEYSTAMAYVCRKYLQYDPTSFKTGTSLKWVQNGDNLLSPAEFFNLVDTLFEALVDSDTRAIFGAIRRVYTPDQLIELTELDEEYTTPIVRNDIVAAAIHNHQWQGNGIDAYSSYADKAFTTTGAANDYEHPVFQDAYGAIHCHLGVYNNNSVSGAPSVFVPLESEADVLLDMYDHLAEPANVLDITASMQVVPKPVTDSFTKMVGSNTYHYSEVVCRAELNLGVRVVSSTGTQSVNKVLTQGTLLSSLTGVGRFSHLDSHPLLCVLGNYLSIGNDTSITYYFGEIDKYTFISKTSMAKLHRKCFFQLLSMPENSKSTT